MKNLTSTLAAVGALLLGGAAAHADVTAIVGGTVHVSAGQVIKDGTVVMKDGIITAVGKGIAVPAGARTIDARGKIITAGLIEASTRIGLQEVALESSTVEGRHKSGGVVIHAAYRVIDGYNPRSVTIPIARRGGITSAVTVPTGGLVSGTSGVVSLGSQRLGKPFVVASAAMYASLGSRSLASAHGSRGYALTKLRELLTDAAQLARRRGNYERNQTRKFAASRLDLEALLPVVQGRLPLVLRVDRAADIRAALRLARARKIRIIISGGGEAWLVAKELAAAKVPVLLDPTDNLPSSFDRVHVRDDAAKRLADAGVLLAISSLGSASNARNLRQRAGVAVANGLSKDQALAAITSAPAKIFGVTNRGTLVRGAVADVVVWTGDPLELSSHAEHVFIGGVDQPLGTRQTELLRRYRTLPRR